MDLNHTHIHINDETQKRNECKSRRCFFNYNDEFRHCEYVDPDVNEKRRKMMDEYWEIRYRREMVFESDMSCVMSQLYNKYFKK